MVSADQRADAIRRMRSSAESLDEWSFEGQVRHADGTHVWLRSRATPSRIPTGEIVWNGVAFEVTEEKRVAEQTRARDKVRQELSEDALRLKDTAIATSINATAIADMNGRLSYVNRSFLQLWGFERESEVLGRPPQAFCVHPDQTASGRGHSIC